MCANAPRPGFVNHPEAEALAAAADSLLARGLVVEADRVVRSLERLRDIRLGHEERMTCGCAARA